MLYFHVKVKFRAFGITFGTLDERPTLDLNLPVLIPNIDRVILDKRGVFIRVSNLPIPK